MTKIQKFLLVSSFFLLLCCFLFLSCNNPAGGEENQGESPISFGFVDLNGNGAGYGWANETWELGANVVGNKVVEFAVYSKNATKIMLEIYDSAYGKDAAHEVFMEKGLDDIWRAKVQGVGAGTLYAFRAWGPNWTYNENWKRGYKWRFPCFCRDDSREKSRSCPEKRAKRRRKIHWIPR